MSKFSGGWRGVLGRSAILATVVLIFASLVLPFVARAYASASIPELRGTVAPDRSDTGAMPAREEGISVGLGTRPLPVMTNDAVKTWRSNPAAAFSEASRAVFDDPDSTLGEIATWWRDLGYIPLSDYPYDTGLAGDVINREFTKEPPAESAVLDLASMFLLLDTDSSSSFSIDVRGPAEQVSLALVEWAAERFDSCDALLSLAFTTSLGAAADRNDVDTLFDRADARCGDDLTPAVAKLVFHRAQDSEAGNPALCQITEIADKITINTWNRVLGDFQSIADAHPNNPAGMIGVGDTYVAAADAMATWGVQPFTIRAYRDRAVGAYQDALEISDVPVLRVSLARAQLAAGHAKAAAVTAKTVPSSQADLAAVSDLLGDIAAANGEYARAAQLSRQPWEAVPDLTATALARSSAGVIQTHLTDGAATVVTENFMVGGCGGSSLTEDRNFIPQSRPSEETSPASKKVEYLLLAEDWSAVQRACTEAMETTDETCEIAVAEGDWAALSSIAADYLQNLYRAADNVDAAAGVVAAWEKNDPTSAAARERRGEIEFLAGRWKSSASASASAAKMYRADPFPASKFRSFTGPGWSMLRESTARRESDDFDAALRALRGVLDSQEEWRSLRDFAPNVLGRLRFTGAGTDPVRVGDFASAVAELERSIKAERL